MSWSYSYSPDVWPALITLALVIYLGAYSWQRRNTPAAKLFTIVCVLGGFWTLGVILEILAVGFSDKIFWAKFQAIWHLPAVTGITCFVLQYAGLGRFLNRGSYFLLSTVPLIGAVVMATNDAHHLMWADFRINGHVAFSPGGMYWAIVGYGYLLSLVNLVVLLRLAIGSPLHRLPVAIMLGSQIVARIGYGVDKLYPGLIGAGEMVLLVVGLMTVAYGLAFLRFHVIDPVAAARRAVLDQMSEGVYVLDGQGRIVYANPMAAEIAGMPAHRLRQRHLTEVLPIDGGLLDPVESQETGQTDLTLGEDDSARRYSLLSSPLKGRKNERIGQLLLVRDVTARWRAQNRVIEEQRMVAKLQEREQLSRELHDGVGQVLGYVSMQAQTALKWMRDGNQEKAGAVLGRIVEVAKDVHADVRETILSLRAGPEKKRYFISKLRNYLDRFQANYGIRTELSLSDGIEENIFYPESEAQLLRIIQEALTNSRKHSGAKNVSVRVEPDTRKAWITITDDGSGFDVRELDHLDGDHFGLVFMRERVAQIGGSLTIDSVPGGGTVLKLAVPVREKEEKRNESASGR
jgi:PAS domain S-box-containing protein